MEEIHIIKHVHDNYYLSLSPIKRLNESLFLRAPQSKERPKDMGRLLSVFFLSSFSLALLLSPAAALPLSTDSRWIVDETGRRVKLACVNWASHLEAVVAEGLSKQPVDLISKQIGSMGFNCVRLTWPLFLATNESLANLTVRKSFTRLGLIESVAGFQANNPSLIDLSLINAYQVRIFPIFSFPGKLWFLMWGGKGKRGRKKTFAFFAFPIGSFLHFVLFWRNFLF